MKRLKLLAVLVVVLCAARASAQTTSGAMFGRVVDSSDQVVPGAGVVITNESTGEQRRATTNEVGEYVFPGLVAGPYTVRAELQGFKPYEIKGNMVLANNRLSMRPLRLEVGSLSETVSVTAVGQTIDTTVTSHQAILDTQQVANLSIRGRDPISLLKILPGVQLQANDQETFGGSFSTPVASVQGGAGQTVYVDGINGGDGGGGGNFSAATNMDAIEEVNVQMSAYTAEYGLKGGAQINLITKHGGSDYHGTGYWYKRHEMFNATNFFNNKTGTPKPVYRYSTLGGTLGGPIPKLPKINENGNKLFFFYSFDDTQLRDVQSLKFYEMPTAAERRGDFSQSVTPKGDLIPVIDPLTGKQFPGNIIPQDRMDPRGVALMNLFPLPNTFGVAGYNYVTQEPSIPHPRRQHIFRGDWRPTDKDSLSIKYQRWWSKSVGINVAGASARWGLVRQRYDFYTNVGKMDYTRVLNSTTILEFSTGFYDGVETGPPEDDKALAGIQRATYPALAGLGQFASIHNPLGLIPQAQFGNVQSADRSSSNDGGTGQVTYDGRWPITGDDIAFNGGINVTHTRGSHTFKAGIMREDELFGQARSGTFAGQFNFADDAQDPLRTGYAYANAFIGHITNYQESLGRRPDDRRQKTWAWFTQDTWKVNKQITLDAGLRMYKWGPSISMSGEASAFSTERFDPTWGGNPPVLFTPITTAQGRRGLNPKTGEIVPATFIGLIVPGTGFSCGVITPTSPCKINGIVTQKDPSYSTAGQGFVNALPIQFDPRIGMAYALNAKTVIRLAGGSFHDGTGGPTLQQGGNPAFQFTRQIFYTDFNSYLSSGNAATSLVPNTDGILRSDTTRPNNVRFTAAVQRELGGKIVLDAAYVGSRTRKFGEKVNINPIAFDARYNPIYHDPTLAAATATNPNALPDAFLRPITGFNDLTIEQPTSHNNYDSLQVQVTRRFTGKFEMAGSYTLAKGKEHVISNADPTIQFMQKRDLQEHVVVASYMYALPNGSHAFGNSGAVRGLLDNWRISGVSTFGTGGRGTISTGNNSTPGVSFSPAVTAPGGEDCGRFNIVGSLDLPRDQRSIDKWFNTAAVQPVADPQQRGNGCDPFHFTMPGWTHHDITLFKDFHIAKGQTFQYRLEIYNLFNTVEFQTVNTAATFNLTTGAQSSNTFGAVTAARNERRMQMSLRYTF